MDKQTLSNYGWVVIAVLVLAVMIALATPFGEYIKAGVESTTAGLFDTSEKALNIIGVSAKEDANLNDWEYELDDENKVIKLNKYIGSSGHVYVPATFTISGTIYNTTVWSNTGAQNSTFANLKTITSVTFENGVVADNMSYMFKGCTSLLSVSNFPKYDGVWWTGVFSGCNQLLSAPQIPNDIENIRITGFYRDCGKLIGNYSMPDSVNSNYSGEVFKNCYNINKSTNVLWFGDSITAGTTTSAVSFIDYLRDELSDDTSIGKYAVGGRTLSYGYDQKEEDKSTSIIYDISNFSCNENVDYVFISAGTNDFAHQSSRRPLGTYRFADIGTVNDTTPSTVSGAINLIAQAVDEKFPNATLVFTTPLPRDRYDIEGAKAADNSVFTVHLKDYVDGMKATFDAHGYNYIDSYTEAGIDIDTDLSDNTHPTLEGQEKLAQYYLNKLVGDYGFTIN